MQPRKQQVILLKGGGERLLGDMLGLLSAALAGASQVSSSFLFSKGLDFQNDHFFGNQNLQVAAAHIVRDFHPSEFLGMLGLCGAIITFVQVRLSLSLFIQVRYLNSLFIHLRTSPFAFHHLCFFFGKYGKLIPKM